MTEAVMKQEELWGHPKGLYVCFFTEMWERFSFYGMKALLVLYLIKYHLFADANANLLMGAYAGLAYSLPFIGGMISDRYLGMRKSVMFGGIMLVIGHFLMAFEGTQATMVNDVITRDDSALAIFYLALAFIIIGVGFLKPNISTIVGKLYKDDDPRRDSGFTIFYMGINLGAFTSTILCGWLGETYGWSYGFGLAGIGMLAGLISFSRGQKHLMGLAEPHDPENLAKKVLGPVTKEWLIYIISVASLAVVWFMVQREYIVEYTTWTLLTVAIAGILLYAFIKVDKVARDKLIVLMVLIASTIVFWSLFAQASTSMTLFADRVVDREMFGFTVLASQFQSLNALFIIIFAPLFAWLWVRLDKLNMNPNLPLKFTLALFFVAAGFGVMIIGSGMANAAGQVAAIWLVLMYFLHTTGELCLSPVGLSAVTKLSPKNIVGFSMGTWFLATGLSEMLAAQIANIAAVDSVTAKTMSVADFLEKYTELFWFMLKLGMGAALVMLIVSFPLKKLMHGIK
ncbi:MAG: peptide MFS transporter [Proteobacteria bacterium]|nr:peptide MFS transporter [Pseudomonadota bacterium]